MSLYLREVPAAQGRVWVMQGLALWWRHPLALAALMLSFIGSVMLLAMLLPGLGGLLGLGLMPLLTLGYILAGRAAALHQPITPRLLLQGLIEGDARRRRALALLGLASMLSLLGLMLLADAVDGGSLTALQKALAEAGQADEAGRKAAAATIEGALADPRLMHGMWLRLIGGALLSLPFWHAPALIHFDGQGAAQALFSSTLAVWRNRGAFLVYALVWLGLSAAAAALMLALAGGGEAGPSPIVMALLPLGLGLGVAFYASLWFMFRDSFGQPPAAGAAPPPSADETPTIAP